MKILLINPNSTASMTRKIGDAARACATPGTTVTALNPETGPPAIQGREDGEAALPGLFALFEREIMQRKAHDLVIIACFDDTGLMDLKKISPVPVIGIGEAAYHAAMLLGTDFSVVTTLSVSVPVIEDNLKKFGLSHRCKRVRASEVPVLALEDSGSSATAEIAAEIEAALAEDEITAIVLGCAGMANLAREMEGRFGKTVLEGVAAAVTIGEGLLRLRRPMAPRNNAC